MGGGGQDGCERRIEVFVKIKKKIVGGGGGGGGGGVRGDVNRELKFCENSKKNWGGGVVGGGGRIGGGQGGCERRIEVFVGLGYGGCEPRIEGIVQGTKRYCTILREN